MKIRDIVRQLEHFAPLIHQENYDNCGLIAGNADSECTGVLVSLDCTAAVIREAAEKNCNLVVSHHPLIFHPVRSVTPENQTGRALMLAIKSDISIYAAHTNLDNIRMGVNSRIADKLELEDRKILRPTGSSADVGSGMIGRLKYPETEAGLLRKLKREFAVPVVRHSPLTSKPVHTVAVCGGAGSFLISNALALNADFFVTADLKYHEFFLGEGKMVIADIGHFESEQYTIDLLHEVILEKCPNFAVLKSGTETNPVNYYI